MISFALKNLINEYKDATSKEDLLIRRKLESIASLCADCNGDEFIFADEITVEFCRIIRMIKEQQQKELQMVAGNYANHNSVTKNVMCYVEHKDRQFRYGEDLLEAFYNHFIEEKSALTLNDYVARIKTFANLYLHEIFSPDNYPEDGNHDVILFIYDNIEIIVKKFNPKNENGETVKQRLNIRSALKKLYEFKHSPKY